MYIRLEWTKTKPRMVDHWREEQLQRKLLRAIFCLQYFICQSLRITIYWDEKVMDQKEKCVVVDIFRNFSLRYLNLMKKDISYITHCKHSQIESSDLLAYLTANIFQLCYNYIQILIIASKHNSWLLIFSC